MPRGSLHVYPGPMASGKTTKVIDELVKISMVTKKKVLFINHGDDIRADKYSTHCGIRDATKVDSITFIKLKKLELIDPSLLSEVDVVGIDEAQFFPDLYNIVKYWVQELGLTVYVSGLDGDSDMKKFGQVSDLSPIADTYEKLNAVCGFCISEAPTSQFVPAPFTKYTGEVKKGGQVVVGGLQIYQPSCRKHHSN